MSRGYKFVQTNTSERIGFRRSFSGYDKLDVMFTAPTHFALIAKALRPQSV